MHRSVAAPAIENDSHISDPAHAPFSHIRLSWYLLIIVLPTLVLMVAAVPWARSLRTAPGKWMMPAMDFRYTLQHVNADVVISGDSTGLVALDPLVMQPELHMSVVNLASLGSIFNVQLDDMLDHYMRSNTPPKLIIVSLSPWNLRQEAITPDNSFEGILMLVRHGSWSDIYHFAAAHPIVALHFDFQLLLSLATSWRHQDTELHRELVEHHGFAPINPPSLTHPCKILKPYAEPAAQDGLAFHFYSKYSTPQTRVLVYMSPVPDCDGSEAFRAPHLHPNWLVPAAVVPASEICQDGMHLEESAVVSNSHIADADIETALGAPAR